MLERYLFIIIPERMLFHTWSKELWSDSLVLCTCLFQFVACFIMSDEYDELEN